MILQKCQKKYNLHLKKSKEMAYYMQNVCSSQHSSVVELLICNQWVAGSNPAAGSIFLCVNCTNEGAEAGKEAYQKTVLCNFCVIPGLPRHSTWFRIDIYEKSCCWLHFFAFLLECEKTPAQHKRYWRIFFRASPHSSVKSQKYFQSYPSKKQIAKKDISMLIIV